MKKICQHETPRAGTFHIAYDEQPNLADPRYIIYVYHITGPEGQVFRIAMIALRSFIPDEASALALMEGDGLVKLKARLNTMDENGYTIEGPGPDLTGGFSLNAIGPENDS